MRLPLKLHPDSRCDAVTALAAEASRPRAGALQLSYAVTGAIAEIRVPRIRPAARAGELWRHTCFEAFIRSATGETYIELNFAPSTLWAAYRFSAYRSGMRDAEIDVPRIEVRSERERITLQTILELDALPPGSWKLGLSAVIEETGGRLSYWALAHPPGKPDFHHADCFACEI